MAKRMPASVRTREVLSALIEGRLASAAGRSELVELAIRLIAEEAPGRLTRAVRESTERAYFSFIRVSALMALLEYPAVWA
jgi:hypothetical protein